jgi:hypothetical protein
MIKLFTGSITVALGLAATIIGLKESVTLLKFWWGVKDSLGIFSSDIIFFSWIIFQSLLYLALTVLGFRLVMLARAARIPVLVLLYADALLKLVAPPVTRTDVVLAAVSILVASILVSGFGRRLFQAR